MNEYSINNKPGVDFALATLNNLSISEYGRSRNFLNGSVSRLSPYISHGILNTREIFEILSEKGVLSMKDKFLMELAWREFFQHVWEHKKEKIFSSLRESIIPENFYKAFIPDDVKNAATGLVPIDNAVRELYSTGYLHNHVRLWLSSYLIHYRKIHWRTGADWLYSLLLDGDLASNHLSWQWVAGTNSSKPYLFNASNVAKYAPRSWHCFATNIDTTYDVLSDLASDNREIAQENKLTELFEEEPSFFSMPPESFPELPLKGIKEIFLQHPWFIKRATGAAFKKNLGVIFLEYHKNRPWTSQRWNFVIQNMKLTCDEIYICSNFSKLTGYSLQNNLHLTEITSVKNESLNYSNFQEKIFAPLSSYCSSFSKFWRTVNVMV